MLVITAVLFFYMRCTPYRSSQINTRADSKGAMLLIQTSSDETTHLYSVSAQYVPHISADSESFYYDSTFGLLTTGAFRDGKNTVFLLKGQYEPIPYSTAGGERFSLFLILDSLLLNDTVYFTTDRVISIFYYEKLYSGLFQNGFTTKMNGNLIVQTAIRDTLFGTIYIEAETAGSYYNLLTDVRDPHALSRVSGHIVFTAVERSSKRSMVIDCLRQPFGFQTHPRDE